MYLKLLCKCCENFELEMFLICVGKHKKPDVATVFVDNRAENYSDWREKNFGSLTTDR